MVRGIVLVDDATDLRRLIGMAFDRDGRLKVLASVENGQLGVDAVREHRPDVVLMDISMPVMDGITATKQLKQDFPDLPIVILTGYDDDRMQQQARQAGADGFIDKSKSLAEVVDAVAAMLGDC